MKFILILPNLDSLKIKMKELKERIDILKKDIKKMINILNKTIENLDYCYNINNDIINNYNNKRINYEILYNINNINNINNNNNNILEDINDIINDNNLKQKLKKIFEIYDKMIKISAQIEKEKEVQLPYYKNDLDKFFYIQEDKYNLFKKIYFSDFLYSLVNFSSENAILEDNYDKAHVDFSMNDSFFRRHIQIIY